MVVRVVRVVMLMVMGPGLMRRPGSSDVDRRKRKRGRALMAAGA